MSKAVSIILPDNLHSLGLKAILQETFSAHVTMFSTFSDFENFNECTPDLLLTDDTIYLENLSYFATIKDKVIIITNAYLKKSSNKRIYITDSQEDIIQKFDDFFKSFDNESNANLLTQREISVLKLVAEGHINKEIADLLGISINTVLSHRKNITSKLGIKSVSGLSVYAIMNGIVTPKA